MFTSPLKKKKAGFISDTGHSAPLCKRRSADENATTLLFKHWL